jgi:hypothetical protein
MGLHHKFCLSDSILVGSLVCASAIRDSAGITNKAPNNSCHYGAISSVAGNAGINCVFLALQMDQRRSDFRDICLVRIPRSYLVVERTGYFAESQNDDSE